MHDVENHGVDKIVTLRVGDLMLHATAPAQMKLGIDDTVRFGWDPARVVLFDRATGISLRHAA